MKSISEAWKSKNGKILLSVAAISIVCFCCVAISLASPQTPSTSSTPTLSALDKQVAELAVAQTGIALTQTAMVPTATLTPAPPTETPLPTVTFTPAPEPIILTGSGDTVVDIVKWDSIALLKATYASGSNFIVSNYDKNGKQLGTPINAIGSYSGIQMLDVFDEDRTTRFQVIASGPWEIQILPLSSVRHVSAPGLIQGVGDDVVFLDGSSPDLFKADATQASSNFIVYTVGSDGSYDLTFNEIAPYTGTAIVNSSTRLVQITATGPWSIEVTTK